MSDESEYDVEPEEFDIYKRKYQLLLERCEILQQVKSLPSETKLLSVIFFFFQNYIVFLNDRKMKDWSTESRK